MIKNYINLIKMYFSLGANNKLMLAKLFIYALLRNLSYLVLPWITSIIVDQATNGEYHTMIKTIMYFFVAGLCYTFFYHQYICANTNNTCYVHNKLQELIMEKVTTYDADFTRHISVPYIINTGFTDVGNINQVPVCLFDIIVETVTIIIEIVILMTINIYVGLGTIVLMVITGYLFANNMYKRDKCIGSQRKQQDNVSGLFGQIVDGKKEVNSFELKEGLKEYLEGYKKLWKKYYTRRRHYTDNSFVLVPMISDAGKALIYGIMIYLIIKGQYSVASLVLIIGYYSNISTVFAKLADQVDLISQNKTRIERVYDVLNYKTKNMMEFGTVDNDTIDGSVEFKNVSFTYDRKIQTMKNVSFKIKPRSFTAIVGKSGSGKSTIFRLLLRLYKANKGEILVDDVNIYDYTKEVYSSNVSIVTQKPFIFDMSIRENLNLVDNNHEKQIEACKRVGIHDYIESLPDGYDTKLVSDAQDLSSGQKQLLSLARTLLSKSEVLLFDEVTSSLDLTTSTEIMEIMHDLKKDHTILMITHKPQLMKMADDILVIDHGKIVGRGPHKKLIKENKYYQVLQKLEEE